MPKHVPSWLNEAARVLEDEGPLVLNRTDLKRLIAEHFEKMQLPDEIGADELVKALVTKGFLLKEKLLPLSRPKSNEESEYRTIEKYVQKKASVVDVALSIRPNSYISHASAAQHHGLVPAKSGDRIYVNKEQSTKPDFNSALTQESIDRAFANAPRTSNLVYGLKKAEIVLLGGKNTGNHGVIIAAGNLGRRVPVTSIERTLVDMTVRPIYSGGVSGVLAAFAKAGHTASIPRIIEALKALRYTYPYHQAVGFYLQRVGVPSAKLAPLRKFEISCNFYLANQMSTKRLDPTWRVYYPEEIDRGAVAATQETSKRVRKQ